MQLLALGMQLIAQCSLQECSPQQRNKEKERKAEQLCSSKEAQGFQATALDTTTPKALVMNTITLIEKLTENGSEFFVVNASDRGSHDPLKPTAERETKLSRRIGYYSNNQQLWITTLAPDLVRSSY